MTAEQLATRLIAEGLVGLPELSKVLPARGGRTGDVRCRTLSRWARTGQLEAIKLGGQWYSTYAALARMVTLDDAPAADNPPEVPEPPTDQERARRRAHARRLMEIAGVR